MGAGHGIDRGINPMARCVVSIPRHSEGIGTCALDVLVKICRHGCAARICGGTDTKNTGKDLNGPECSRYNGGTVLYHTFVRLQYKVQWKNYGMYNISTCMDVKWFKGQEHVPVALLLGLLGFASGVSSFVCSYVSSMGNVLTNNI